MPFDQLHRREIITLLGGAIAAWPLPGRAQQAARVFQNQPVVADLYRNRSTLHRCVPAGAARARLQNITLEYRLTDGSPARASEAAADLVTRKVDVILAWTTTMANAAQRATAIIPIVIVGISDPIGTGLVGSLARPRGNVTGLGNFARDLSGKLVEVLVEAVPGISSLAALANPDNPSAHPLLLLIWGAQF